MMGQRLRGLREDHDLTQEELARLLKVSVPTVRAWERNISSPGYETLIAICRLYGVSSDYLLGLTEVDPTYLQRRRFELFSKEELDDLAKYEAFLLWKKGKKK